jgi:hypothetical protein
VLLFSLSASKSWRGLLATEQQPAIIHETLNIVIVIA